MPPILLQSVSNEGSQFYLLTYWNVMFSVSPVSVTVVCYFVLQ